MPYIGLTRDEMGEVHLQNGMFVDIFKELSKLLNFSYHAIEPPDGQWGAMKSDGKWSGMVGQLEEKVVDFGMPSQQYLFRFINSNWFFYKLNYHSCNWFHCNWTKKSRDDIF